MLKAVFKRDKITKNFDRYVASGRDEFSGTIYLGKAKENPDEITVTIGTEKSQGED